MTERFHIINGAENFAKYGIFCKPVLEDEVTGEQYILALDLMDLLNELHEENEQLKMKSDNLIKISAMTQLRNDKLSKENKELQQFKEQAFTLIDKHIAEERRFPREIALNEERAMLIERKIGKVELLETLKKELAE